MKKQEKPVKQVKLVKKVKPFNEAKGAYFAAAMFGIVATLVYLYATSSSGNSALLLLVFVIALAAGLFIMVFVIDFLNGCQQSLDTLNKISDQLEIIANAVNRNNGRDGES